MEEAIFDLQVCHPRQPKPSKPHVCPSRWLCMNPTHVHIQSTSSEINIVGIANGTLFTEVANIVPFGLSRIWFLGHWFVSDLL
jgi:hypothetical protein